MAKEVVLTAIAEDDFNNIINYLTLKWGVAVATNFIERFDNITILLSENPTMFPFFDINKKLQKCFITKHNILYFKETDSEIRILTIFDTRQNPKKLSLII